MSRIYLVKRVVELLEQMRQGYKEDWPAEKINELYYEKERYEGYLIAEEKARYEYYIKHGDDKYHDRCGDEKLSEAIYESVADIDEKQVAIFIEVCLNRIKELETNGERMWHERDLLKQIEIVNTSYRHQVFDVDATFAIDILENEGAWRTWQEPFITCLNRLARGLGLSADYMF